MNDEMDRLLTELRLHLLARVDPTPVVLQTAPSLPVQPGQGQPPPAKPRQPGESRNCLQWLTALMKRQKPEEGQKSVTDAINKLTAEAGKLKNQVGAIQKDVAEIKTDVKAIKKKVVDDPIITDPDFIARVRRQIADARTELGTFDGQLTEKLKDYPVPPTTNGRNRRSVTDAQVAVKAERDLLTAEEAKLATATEPVAAEISRAVKSKHDTTATQVRDVLLLPKPRS
jgi:hypothetical protein